MISNGPYRVSGNVPLIREKIVADSQGFSLRWQKTHTYKTPAVYLLCRCGKSKNMPFCDNSHLHHNFKGKETASHASFIEQAEQYEGKELTLLDAYDLCASARFCDRAGGIWDLIKKDDKESLKIAKEEAADCPSGRLVLIDKKSGKQIEPGFLPEISVTEDPQAGVSGPLWIKGGIEIESEDGSIYEQRNRVTLCRCGNSQNKPFCDSEHIHTKFDDGDGSLK